LPSKVGSFRMRGGNVSSAPVRPSRRLNIRSRLKIRSPISWRWPEEKGVPVM